MGKICSVCKIYKPLDAFYASKTSNDRLQAKCKDCFKSYYLSNLQYRKEYLKKYQILNKESLSKKAKEYRIKNQDVIKKKNEYYRHDFHAHAKRMYSKIKERLKSDKSYSSLRLYINREEFLDWVINNPSYTDLYNRWKESNFNQRLTPTIDRINNKGNYTLDNIQVLTKSDNLKKRWIDTYQEPVFKGNTKRCPICKLYKTFDYFSFDRHSPTKCSTYCRECKKIKYRETAHPHKQKKKVICHQTKIVYESISEACRLLGVNSGKVSLVCMGKRKHTKGYTFEYAK